MEEPEILIVDDNPEIREVAMVLLQGEGFTVDEAGDGKEALDKIEHGAYDLILLDVMMPGLNGYQNGNRTADQIFICIAINAAAWFNLRKHGFWNIKIFQNLFVPLSFINIK